MSETMSDKASVFIELSADFEVFLIRIYAYSGQVSKLLCSLVSWHFAFSNLRENPIEKKNTKTRGGGDPSFEKRHRPALKRRAHVPDWPS